MPVPPLSYTPHLTRLLVPGEAIIYTAKLHPLYGWPWLLLALLVGAPALLGLSWGHYAILPATVIFIVYLLPFKNWECAVTTQRLLLRFGRFGVMQNDISPKHIDHTQLRQNTLTHLLHAGHVTLNLVAFRELRILTLKYMWHPLTFLEALETLTMQEQGK